jgi:hypothetical protein
MKTVMYRSCMVTEVVTETVAPHQSWMSWRPNLKSTPMMGHKTHSNSEEVD